MALNNFVKSIRNIMRNDAGINGDAQRIEQIAWMLFLKVYDEKENDWEFNEDDYKSFIPENCRWRNWAKDNGDGEAITADALLDFVNNTLFPTLKGLEVNPSTPMRSAIVRTTFEDANQYMKDGVLLRQVINVIDQLDLGDYEESHAFGEIYESILKEMQSAGSAGEFYTPRALTDFMAEIINPKVGEKMADFACGTGGFITSWLKALDKKVQTAEDKEEYTSFKDEIKQRMFNLNKAIAETEGLNEAYQIGAAYFRKVLDYINEKQPFECLWNNHLKGLLFEYLRGNRKAKELLEKLYKAYNMTVADE